MDHRNFVIINLTIHYCNTIYLTEQQRLERESTIGPPEIAERGQKGAGAECRP